MIISGTSLSQERERSEDGDEDSWTTWGRIANDWDSYKKKTAHIKVSITLEPIINFIQNNYWRNKCFSYKMESSPILIIPCISICFYEL